jgi:LysR family transcriptional regulator, transcriptional activator of nhaA
MLDLNYRQLHCFWTVAREGTVTGASAVLGVTQPAVSAQVSRLERMLGQKLFVKRGRNLVLTESGRLVLNYAERIFGLGQEMQDELRARESGRLLRISVGLTTSLCPFLALHLIGAFVRRSPAVRVVARHGTQARLLADLADGAVDMVITDDAPSGGGGSAGSSVRLLLESPVAVMAPADQAARYVDDFPRSLRGAPFLLPSREEPMRRGLDQWFRHHRVNPAPVVEAPGWTLASVALATDALFVAPTVAAPLLAARWHAAPVGAVEPLASHAFAVLRDPSGLHPATEEILRAGASGP